MGPLLDRSARVVAVELHEGRAQRLRARWPSETASRRLVVLRLDALELRLPRSPFTVVANPPYAIVTPVLRLLLSPASRLRSGYVVLPRQVARRWASRDAPAIERRGRDFSVEIAMSLPRSAFKPPPRVDSVLLVIRRR